MNSIDFVFRFGRKANISICGDATILGVSKFLNHNSLVILIGWKEYNEQNRYLCPWSLSNWGLLKKDRLKEEFRQPPSSNDYFNYVYGYWVGVKDIRSIDGISQSQLECVSKRISKCMV